MMKIIAITGGSGSGKSTLATALKEHLKSPIITEDDYYLNNANTPGFHPGTFNFDDLAARDHELLTEHLRLLKSGHPIQKPNYCFKTHQRLSSETPMDPGKFLIVEGIHLLCRPTLRSLFDLSVYIDIPDDIRLARRLLRDVNERSRTPESVISQYINTVRPAHEQFTGPSKAFADLMIRPVSSFSDTAECRSSQLNTTIMQVLKCFLERGWLTEGTNITQP